MKLLHDSPQLELVLGDVRKSIPWEGMDLRGLTKGGKLLFLQQERKKSASVPGLDDQLELFEHLQDAPSYVYDGAPSIWD